MWRLAALLPQGVLVGWPERRCLRRACQALGTGIWKRGRWEPVAVQAVIGMFALARHRRVVCN